MTQKSIFVIISPDQIKERLNGFDRLKLSKGQRGMKADAQGRILKQAHERLKSRRVSGFSQYLGRLSTDFHILVPEELKQGSDRTDILVLTVGPTPRNLAYSPDRMQTG